MTMRQLKLPRFLLFNLLVILISTETFAKEVYYCAIVNRDKVKCYRAEPVMACFKVRCNIKNVDLGDKFNDCQTKCGEDFGAFRANSDPKNDTKFKGKNIVYKDSPFK